MEREAQFVIWLVLGVLIFALVGMGGCDYWPPALQAENEALRAQLNDALDENQRLSQELAGVKTSELSYPYEGIENLRRNEDRQRGLGPPTRPATHVTTEGLEPSVGVGPSSVRKGSFDFLQLTHPPHRGTRVAQLQSFLQRQGSHIRVDGIYGPDTEAAVRSFQRRHALPADGVVGPTTSRMLRHTEPLPKLVRQFRLKRPPLSGPDASAVQHALRRAGYQISIDGYFGHQTKTAVMRFQRKHGLEPDGIVGTQTWKALRKAP